MATDRYDTDELLRRYLTGALTAPEEAELERRAREDGVLGEALRGLRSAPAADHAARVLRLKAAARARAGLREAVVAKRPPPRRRYYAAAAALLLLVAAVFLLPRFTETAGADLALATETTPTSEAAPVPSPEAVAPPGETDEQRTEPGSSDREPSPTSVPQPAPQTPSPVAKQTPPAIANQATEQVESIVEEAAVEAEAPTAGAPPPVAVLPPPAVPEEVPNDNLVREAADAHAEADRKVAARRRQRESLRKEAARANADRPADAGRLLIGRITDDAGEPIERALVRLPGLPLGQRTDSNGIFRMEVDAVVSTLEVSHPDFTQESVPLNDEPNDLQITLDRERKAAPTNWTEAWSVTRVPLAKVPGYAIPEEGYAALRARIEAGRPENVPPGKVRLSFLVHPDGTLSDFVFRGEPDQATMDYVGETILMTSIWNVLKGDDPVRVHFRVNFE